MESKEIKPFNPKVNQHQIFIGSPNAEAEVEILWLPDVKSRLIRKDPDAGKDLLSQEKEKGMTEKGMTEDDGWMASLL